MLNAPAVFWPKLSSKGFPKFFDKQIIALLKDALAQGLKVQNEPSYPPFVKRFG